MELENYIAQISRGRGMTIKQMPSGAFACKHKQSFFHDTWRPTAREARIERLMQIGRQANNLLSAVTEQLRQLQAINEDDPTGWLA